MVVVGDTSSVGSRGDWNGLLSDKGFLFTVTKYVKMTRIFLDINLVGHIVRASTIIRLFSSSQFIKKKSVKEGIAVFVRDSL